MTKEAYKFKIIKGVRFRGMKNLLLEKLVFLFLSSVVVTAVLLGHTLDFRNDNSNAATNDAMIYTSKSMGHNGFLEVSVTIKEDVIKQVEVLSHIESPDVAKPAIEQIPEAIENNQHTSVDIVTGATVTSEAIIRAVEDCLNQATAEGNWQ